MSLLTTPVTLSGVRALFRDKCHLPIVPKHDDRQDASLEDINSIRI